MAKDYDLTNTMEAHIFDSKMKQCMQCRAGWPTFCTIEEDEALQHEKWNGKHIIAGYWTNLEEREANRSDLEEPQFIAWNHKVLGLFFILGGLLYTRQWCIIHKNHPVIHSWGFHLHLTPIPNWY